MRRLLLLLMLPMLFMAACSDPDRPTIGLYMAVHRSDLDQIKRHIFWGTDINQTDANGQTPLHVAAEKGRLIVAKLLLEHGANIEGKDSEGHPPIHAAVMAGRTQIAQLLIGKGAQFNTNNLLYHAVQKNVADRDVIEFLIQHGADINQVHKDGLTPLLEAINHDHRALVKLLIINGADVNKPSSGGKMPLQAARQRKNSSIIRLLQRNGASTGTTQ